MRSRLYINGVRNFEPETASFLGGRFWGRGATLLGGGQPRFPPDLPVTSGYSYTSGGDYCAPGVPAIILLRSALSAASPAVPANGLQPFKGPTEAIAAGGTNSPVANYWLGVLGD